MPDYGNAPYQESAFKSALRLLAAGASGAGRAVAGDPFASFGNAFGAQQQASSAAQQAAQAYAQKQQEFEERARHNRESEAYTNALIERQKKPEPVPKVDIHSASPDQWQQYLERVEQEAKAKAAGRPVKAGAKPPKYKPPAVPPRPGDAYNLNTGLKVNAQDIEDIQGIQRATASDSADLAAAANNPLTPPAVKAAAAKRLRELGIR